jgi:hypothetical protein
MAVQSIKALQQQYRTFRAVNLSSSSDNRLKDWDAVENKFEFQLQLLHGLVQRSQANNARIQNEISLVSRQCVDGATYTNSNRLSILRLKKTAKFKYRSGEKQTGKLQL